VSANRRAFRRGMKYLINSFLLSSIKDYRLKVEQGRASEDEKIQLEEMEREAKKRGLL
jgi:hypothetical protein